MQCADRLNMDVLSVLSYWHESSEIDISENLFELFLKVSELETRLENRTTELISCKEEIASLKVRILLLQFKNNILI